MSKNPSMKKLLTEWRKNLLTEAHKEEYDTVEIEGSKPAKIIRYEELNDYGEWEEWYDFEYFCNKENKYVADGKQYQNAPYHRAEEVQAEAGMLKEKEPPAKKSYEEELKLRQSMGSTSGSLKHTTPAYGDGSRLGRREDDWIV